MVRRGRERHLHGQVFVVKKVRRRRLRRCLAVPLYTIQVLNLHELSCISVSLPSVTGGDTVFLRPGHNLSASFYPKTQRQGSASMLFGSCLSSQLVSHFRVTLW